MSCPRTTTGNGPMDRATRSASAPVPAAGSRMRTSPSRAFGARADTIVVITSTSAREVIRSRPSSWSIAASARPISGTYPKSWSSGAERSHVASSSSTSCSPAEAGATCTGGGEAPRCSATIVHALIASVSKTFSDERGSKRTLFATSYAWRSISGSTLPPSTSTPIEMPALLRAVGSSVTS
jgi:hypothetical protein